MNYIETQPGKKKLEWVKPELLTYSNPTSPPCAKVPSANEVIGDLAGTEFGPS